MGPRPEDADDPPRCAPTKPAPPQPLPAAVPPARHVRVPTLTARKGSALPPAPRPKKEEREEHEPARQQPEHERNHDFRRDRQAPHERGRALSSRAQHEERDAREQEQRSNNRVAAHESPTRCSTDSILDQNSKRVFAFFAGGSAAGAGFAAAAAGCGASSSSSSTGTTFFLTGSGSSSDSSDASP